MMNMVTIMRIKRMMSMRHEDDEHDDHDANADGYGDVNRKFYGPRFGAGSRPVLGIPEILTK